jgi:hypothetical protein
MKISARTLNILKNFSGINNSILIDKGSVIETISREQNIIAIADVEERFPCQFAIYELNLFLAAISLFKDPDFEFGPKSVKISNGKTKIEYVYCQAEMIPGLTDSLRTNLKALNTPFFSFKLKNEDLQNLLKAGATLDLPDFNVACIDKAVKAIVVDSKNPSSNKFSIELEVENDLSEVEDFQYIFKFDNLKLYPGNYIIDICCTKGKEESALGKFKHDSDLTYFIAIEDVK